MLRASCRFASRKDYFGVPRNTAFSAFLKASAGRTDLPGGRPRGQAIGALWRGLSAAEKEEFKKAAVKMPVPKRVTKKKKVTPKTNEFVVFVKENMSKCRSKNPRHCMGVLARKWHAVQAAKRGAEKRAGCTAYKNYMRELRKK